MIYLLIVMFIAILGMGYHIAWCHAEIKQIKECLIITSNSLERERARNESFRGYVVNPYLTKDIKCKIDIDKVIEMEKNL